MTLSTVPNPNVYICIHIHTYAMLCVYSDTYTCPVLVCFVTWLWWLAPSIQVEGLPRGPRGAARGAAKGAADGVAYHIP